MTSQIKTGDEANRLGQIIDRETVLVFAVRYDAKRHQIVFLGTEALTAALEQGIEIEKYVNDKIAQARERLVKQQ